MTGLSRQFPRAPSASLCLVSGARESPVERTHLPQSVEDFLADVLPRHIEAAEALHHGKATPMSNLLGHGAPLSLFPGMAEHQTRRGDILSTFSEVAARFTDSTPLTFELIAADVDGDLGYVVGYEHSEVSLGEGQLVRNDLRATHVYRREAGTWHLVHRHGGGGPTREPPRN